MEFINIKENEIEVVRGDKPYKEREGGVARHSLRYILGDLGDIKQEYFILGFHLNEFAQNEYYKDFGYDSMKDFCLANIPIEYSSLSRCMSVHKYTCERLQNGYPDLKTNRMQEKYKEYGYSQLVEMVGMSEEEEKLCTPSMTVKEIRELKKQIKEKRKSSQAEKSDNCDVATTEKENKSAEETTTELSQNEKQEDDLKGCEIVKVSDDEVFASKEETLYRLFTGYPGEFVSKMFRDKFGNDIPVTARGKMVEMKIPGYEVTIRISFKETE